MSKRYPNRIEAALEYAQQLGEKYMEDMREYQATIPYGVRDATPAEDEAFVRMMIAQNPPQVWVSPEGEMEYNSAWVIALRDKIVDEPKGAWRGVKAALERIGPLPVPMAPSVAQAPPMGVMQ